eukprot:gene23957-9529_t
MLAVARPVSRPASCQHAAARQLHPSLPLRPCLLSISAGRTPPQLHVSAKNSSHSRRALICQAQDVFRFSNVRKVPTLEPEASSPRVKHFDFLVIGSGIAGLTYALKVAEHGTVAIITKEYAHEGCTQYAQGGICAVLDQNDSVANHVSDTIVAGAYLNDPKAVEVVCREGPARVLELVALGAKFTSNEDGSLHLTKEGGHGHRRIVHANDMTGKEIERALLTMARANKNINFHEHHLATELITDEYLGVPHCFGADVFDQQSNSMCRFIGLSTMLASGGAGQLYPNTTNPHVATGDGVAMAYRAGIQVSNMEFIQFHPTSLYQADRKPTESSFLITEAVRGEGGRLYNAKGERFMGKYDERLELAPRDIVARSIHEQMREHGDPYVLLDITHKPKDAILHHFPNIALKCSSLGIDITQDAIPVVPAQHYTCGGVQTGLRGETSVQGLYACGEVTCTGLHGANRLASNSLLEGLVFAERAVSPSVAHAEHAWRNCSRQLLYAANSADFSEPLSSWVRAKRQQLRQTMWDNCGIVRRTSELQAALDDATVLEVEAQSILKSYGMSTELMELANLSTVAKLVTSCALQRRESRGGHYILDYPHLDKRECRPSMVCLTRELGPAQSPNRLRAAPAGAALLLNPIPNKLKRDSLVRMRAMPKDE